MHETTTPPTRRSQDEIDELKRGWQRDPIWDIEDTEGFEAHRDELRAYRLEMAAKWDQQYEDRISQNWLRKAKEAALRKGSEASPSELAAVAQAEGITRIAEVLETMLENDLVRGGREERGIVSGEQGLHLKMAGLLTQFADDEAARSEDEA